jgi:hypothetical protein
MARGSDKLDKRITTRFDASTNTRILEWGRAHGARTLAEALRMIVTYTIAKPPDRAFAAAYQQNLAELRSLTREALLNTINEIGERVKG